MKKPKYKYNDVVSFPFKGGTVTGSIHIIDPYGTFEDNTEPSYDIMAEYEGQATLFKHIKESWIF